MQYLLLCFTAEADAMGTAEIDIYCGAASYPSANTPNNRP